MECLDADRLKTLCAELSADPSAANRDLDPRLRGWSIYPQADGTQHVAFSCGHSGSYSSAELATAVLALAADGAVDLSVSLAAVPRSDVACREATRAAAEAARPPGVQLTGDDETSLRLLIRLAPPVEAEALARALCSLELAALGCAREVRGLASDAELASAYLALRSARARSALTSLTRQVDAA